MTDPDSSQGPLGDESPPSSTREPVAEEPSAPVLAGDPSQASPLTPTRASGFWAAVVVGLLVLVLLSVFILENQQRASVSFFGVHGHLPEGVALLLAAVIGGLFVVIAAVARILELRSHAARPQRKPGRTVTRRGRAGA
jgi:uncharacterized integral membrane protein